MYKNIKALIVFFLFLSLAYTPVWSADTLKIVTFNLYGRPDTDWNTRLTMDLDELEQIRPDIIGLQEVVEPAGGNTARQLCDSLSERTGLPYRYIYARTHFSWNTYDEGIAIVTPHILIEDDVRNLTAGIFQRKCIMARILTPLGIVDLFNTHLSYGTQQDIRNQQVQDIRAFIKEKSSDGQADLNLLCGDFNSGPASPSVQMLTNPDSGAVYLDSWHVINPSDPGYTVPSDAPNDRIDYIFLHDGDFGNIFTSQQVMAEPNASDLYPSDHIGVMSTFGSTVHKAALSILQPAQEQEVSGIFAVSWALGNQAEEMTFSLYISRDAGRNWQELWNGASAENSYSWDTNSFPDGTRYKLKIAAFGDSSFGLAETGTFTVNNPGNAPPEIEIISPRKGSIIHGNYPVKWSAADAEGDSLTISLNISADNGQTWQPLVQDYPNSGNYEWMSAAWGNSPNHLLIAKANDGLLSAADTAGLFEVRNERSVLPDSIIVHVLGSGSGSVEAQTYDPAQLTGHTYRLTFDDSSFSSTVYNVQDLSTQEQVVQNAPQLDGLSEGPLFDGMRLIIDDFPRAEVNNSASGWQNSQTNLIWQISLAHVLIGSDIINGYPYPADYKITLFDYVVDTSATFLGAAATPMKFNVENISEQRQIDIIFIDSDADYSISALDEIYILEKDTLGQDMLTWYVFFTGYDPITLPQAGDIFSLVTFKPFSSADVFEISTAPVGIFPTGDQLIARKYQLQQNYPNPFNPQTVISYQLSAVSKVELSVYNVLGQRIRTLVSGKQQTGHYKIVFDGHNLASGLYIYQLKAGNPSVGSGQSFIQTRKMILLR